MRVIQDIKLDFSDVLIQPKNTSLNSRSEVDLQREFKFLNTCQIWKGIPLIASNMDTVGTPEMYHSLKNHGMLTCFHKFLDDYPEFQNAKTIIYFDHKENVSNATIEEIKTLINNKWICHE